MHDLNQRMSCGALHQSPELVICLRRIGLNTNHAISAATAFMMLATMNTACQLPVAAASTLDSGTSSEAVPLAVYSRPALAAAYFEPKVSAQVDGKRL